MGQQQFQQVAKSSAPAQGYFTTEHNNLRSPIRLPTVPVPTTSMFSSAPSSVISPTQNYLFTSLPQHSTQPTFDVAMLQAKPIGANQSLNANRIVPVSSNSSNDTFQQFLNLP